MLDYYQVLGVKSTASVKEIKTAYKRLARLQHPDLNGGPEATKAFVQISHARDILVDPKRRAAYDAQRHAYAVKGANAPVVNPTFETYVRRVRSDVRIKKNLEKFLTIEREEAHALRQAVFPLVAFLLASFFVPLVRPHLWRSSGWTGRTLILVLFSIGLWHTVSKIWAAIKLHTDDDRTVATDDQMLARQWSRRQAILVIAGAAMGCALVGTLIGISLADSLLSAMPMFFDRTIRLELLLYPWIIVLLIDGVHSLSQKIDI
ncbi:MAG TPA: J domain-containing protein [Pyrinomonadaceae bacterium]|nr:J domain-containing protein [Pyrinomonadaceae bacterium]